MKMIERSFLLSFNKEQASSRVLPDARICFIKFNKLFVDRGSLVVNIHEYDMFEF